MKISVIMPIELQILNFAFRPLSDEDDAEVDTGDDDTLDDDDEDEEDDDMDAPDVEPGLDEPMGELE